MSPSSLPPSFSLLLSTSPLFTYTPSSLHPLSLSPLLSPPLSLLALRSLAEARRASEPASHLLRARAPRRRARPELERPLSRGLALLVARRARAFSHGRRAVSEPAPSSQRVGGLGARRGVLAGRPRSRRPSIRLGVESNLKVTLASFFRFLISFFLGFFDFLNWREIHWGSRVDSFSRTD